MPRHDGTDSGLIETISLEPIEYLGNEQVDLLLLVLLEQDKLRLGSVDGGKLHDDLLLSRYAYSSDRI